MDNAVYEVPCPAKKGAVQYRNAVQYMVFHCQQGTAVNESISAKRKRVRRRQTVLCRKGCLV
jgi:hypothetical protein